MPSVLTCNPTANRTRKPWMLSRSSCPSSTICSGALRAQFQFTLRREALWLEMVVHFQICIINKSGMVNVFSFIIDLGLRSLHQLDLVLKLRVKLHCTILKTSMSFRCWPVECFFFVCLFVCLLACLLACLFACLHQ